MKSNDPILAQTVRDQIIDTLIRRNPYRFQELNISKSMTALEIFELILDEYDTACRKSDSLTKQNLNLIREKYSESQRHNQEVRDLKNRLHTVEVEYAKLKAQVSSLLGTCGLF